MTGMGEGPPFLGTHSWEVFDVVPAHRLNDPHSWFPGAARPDPRPPRPAATVVPLRASESTPGLEVWMMRRRPELVFGGAWVFPGGKVDPEDREHTDPLVACALREVAEEAGVTLGPDQLVPWARWITPVDAPARFDTHFFVACLPEQTQPVNASDEADRVAWFDLSSLVGADEDPDRPRIISPTRTVLWELSLLGSWDAIRVAAETRVIEPVLARRVPKGDTWHLSHPRRDGTWT